MAPIKFEEDIRERLEKRQLQQSTDAWQKLSDRLEAEPEKKNHKTYWWLGIAASFVGLIIVSSILFSKGSDTSINTPALVEEKTKNGIEEEGVIKNKVAEEQTTQETQIALGELEKEEKNTKKEIIPLNEVVVETVDNKPIRIVENVIEDKTTKVAAVQETAGVGNVKSIKTVEEQKVDEVVAQIQKLQEEKSTVTDAEIDALLDRAQKELTSKYDTSTKTVDAELLLLQVETDLDQSFRDRVFEALDSGYKKVRTAVAERNN